MNDFSKYVKHHSDLLKDAFSYPGSTELHCLSAQFGKFFEFKDVGINYNLLKPGRRTSYPHAEEQEDEFIYVLRGNPDVWIDGYTKRLSPGDGVGFPAGTGVCHTFINNTDSDVELLVVGESKPTSKIYYPLNPEREEQVRPKNLWWDEVPKNELGPHDGLPDKLRADRQHE